MQLDCRGYALALDVPVVMGVLNVTPDSFSDGGQYAERPRRASRTVGAWPRRGRRSSTSGANPRGRGRQTVDTAEELARVIPVIEALARAVTIPISVDTSKPEVMRAAVAAGARMINDVRALRAPGALEAAAASGAAVCLMHMQGEPRDMQTDPRYGDVVTRGPGVPGRARRSLRRGRDPAGAAVHRSGDRFRQARGAQSGPARTPGRADLRRHTGPGRCFAEVADRYHHWSRDR